MNSTTAHNQSGGRFRKIVAIQSVCSPLCQLAPSERLVAIAIISHADGDGVCWPGHQRLAAGTGLSRRTIIKAVKRISTDSAAPVRLDVEHRWRGGGGGQMTNRYFLRHANGELAARSESESASSVQNECKSEPSKGDAAAHKRITNKGSKERTTSGALPDHVATNIGGTGESRGDGAGGKPLAAAASESTIMCLYAAEYARVRGVRPPITAADRRACSRLLMAVDGDADRAAGVIESAFRHDYWGRRATLQLIANDPARFLPASVSAAGRDDTDSPARSEHAKRTNTCDAIGRQAAKTACRVGF